jgi:L-fucose isomerase-like protein
MKKPKIGLFLLRAEWFDSVVALPALVDAVREDEQAIRAALEEAGELVSTWVVDSAGSLAEAVRAARSGDADLFVLVFQVWAEDFYLKPLVAAIGGRPLAVWCYLPWERPPRPAPFVSVLRGSGPVGTFEGLGTLRNLGVRFFFTQGAPGDPRVQSDLAAYARAAQVRRALQSARFGLLPGRNEQMQSTFVDEFRLLAEIGPLVFPLSVGDLQRKSQALPDGEVAAYLEHLRAAYPIRNVSSETLALAARASLALARLAVDGSLDLLSLNDIAPELHEVIGLRPCLYPPILEEAGIPLGLEGDLGAATALFVLHRLAGPPLLFTEIWFWDEAENVVVGGHAGPVDPRLARPGKAWISHDFEYAQSDRSDGAHFQLVARPGRVTLLQLRGTPGGWQAILVGGEALDTEPWLEGYPHAAVRLDFPVDTFVRRVANVGSTQHWIMAYGDVSHEVLALCELLGVPVEWIR